MSRTFSREEQTSRSRQELSHSHTGRRPPVVPHDTLTGFDLTPSSWGVETNPESQKKKENGVGKASGLPVLTDPLGARSTPYGYLHLYEGLRMCRDINHLIHPVLTLADLFQTPSVICRNTVGASSRTRLTSRVRKVRLYLVFACIRSDISCTWDDPGHRVRTSGS